MKHLELDYVYFCERLSLCRTSITYTFHELSPIRKGWSILPHLFSSHAKLFGNFLWCGWHHCAFLWFFPLLELVYHFCHLLNVSIENIWFRSHTVTHSTPSCELICSISRSCINSTCGCPTKSAFSTIPWFLLTRNIRMNSHRKNELIILPIEIIKMISPKRFHRSCINPAMTRRHFLHKHHRR